MKVRVIEYWVTVEGQEVPEMFCLVTDLMDWEDYPAPELAALYRRRWDGSETALREAKAVLRGAGPGTGPMLRSGSPDLVPGLPAAWAAGTGITRRVVLDVAVAAVPARKGRRAGLTVRPRDLSFARAVRAVLSAIRLGHDCYQTVTSEIGQYRAVVDRDRHRDRKVQVPLVLRARGTGGHRHPHRPRRHYHGQRPSLTSTNSGHPPGRGPFPDRGPGRPARHAAFRHARRKGTTRSNQKQEVPTTGQTAKAPGIGSSAVTNCTNKIRAIGASPHRDTTGQRQSTAGRDRRSKGPPGGETSGRTSARCSAGRPF